MRFMMNDSIGWHWDKRITGRWMIRLFLHELYRLPAALFNSGKDVMLFVFLRKIKIYYQIQFDLRITFSISKNVIY